MRASRFATRIYFQPTRIVQQRSAIRHEQLVTLEHSFCRYKADRNQMQRFVELLSQPAEIEPVFNVRSQRATSGYQQQNRDLFSLAMSTFLAGVLFPWAERMRVCLSRQNTKTSHGSVPGREHHCFSRRSFQDTKEDNSRVEKVGDCTSSAEPVRRVQSKQETEAAARRGREGSCTHLETPTVLTSREAVAEYPGQWSPFLAQAPPGQELRDERNRP